MSALCTQQSAICAGHGSKIVIPYPNTKIGIALATLDKAPLNALRHPPVANSSGWYIWGGEEFSDAPDFFQSLHVEHVAEYCPEIMPYLALSPGWRVLLAPGQEDVWYDENLINV